MYTIKKYGDTSLWNLTPDENPLNPSDVIVTSKSSTHLTGLIESDNIYTINATGNFQFPEAATSLREVSGKMLEATVLKNGSLINYESWGDGYNLSDSYTYSLERELSYMAGDDTFEGSSDVNNDDGAQGLEGDDTFIGYGDEHYHDMFYGGDGIDKAIYRGNRENYLVEQVNDIWDSRIDDGSLVSGWVITDTDFNRDGIDNLNEVERALFADGALAFDTNLWDNAGSAYRLYKAAFDRAPDEVGLGYWIDQLDEGASLQLAASGFIHSAEFESLYGANPSDTLFLTKLYNNVLDRDPDQGGLNYWIDKLNGGMNRESALINFSESNENVSNVADLIANGIQYQPWLS